MLTAAVTPESPEHAAVVDFLRDRQLRKSFALSLRALRDPPPPPPSSAPIPGTIPLLTLVSGPSEPPRYEPTNRPLPLSELGGSGIRRAPVLESAGGIPFLRIKKPQPRIMNRILLAKLRKMQKLSDTMNKLAEKGHEEAEWEDRWENALKGTLGVNSDTSGPTPTSHHVARREAIKSVRDTLLTIRETDYARGCALQELVKAERELVEKEQEERRDLRKKGREESKSRGERPAEEAIDPSFPAPTTD